MVYYKLGGEKLKELYRDIVAMLQDYGNRRPLLKKLLLIAMAGTVVLFLVSWLGSAFFPESFSLKALGYGGTWV